MAIDTWPQDEGRGWNPFTPGPSGQPIGGQYSSPGSIGNPNDPNPYNPNPGGDGPGGSGPGGGGPKPTPPTGPIAPIAAEAAKTAAIKKMVAALVALAGGLGGRALANRSGDPLTDAVPPELSQLLQMGLQRQTYQNPLFQAATQGAFEMLPTFAKKGAALTGSLPTLP